MLTILYLTAPSRDLSYLKKDTPISAASVALPQGPTGNSIDISVSNDAHVFIIMIITNVSRVVQRERAHPMGLRQKQSNQPVFG